MTDVTDQLGQAIDDPRIQAVFARRDEVDGLIQSLNDVAATLRQAGRDKDELFDSLNIAATVRALADITKALEAAKPHILTPPDAAERWRRRGWLTKPQHDQLGRFGGGDR